MSDLKTRIEHAIARKPFAKAAEEVLAELETTHLLIPRPETMPAAYRDPKTMMLWELAQSLAINSDLATHSYERREENDASDPHYRHAMEYYQRRNDCIRELRDREAAAIPFPRDEFHRLLSMTWNGDASAHDLMLRVLNDQPGDVEDA